MWVKDGGERGERGREETHINIKSRVWHDALTIIDIQGAGRSALEIESGNDAPRILTRVARRHGGLLRGDDIAATDEDWYVAEGGVDGGILARRRVDCRLRVPVVPNGSAPPDAREDAVDGGGALRQDGSDHDCRAEEELAIDSRKGGIVGEFPGHSAHHCATGGVGEVEEGVHVGEQLETDVHGSFAGVDDAGPDVGFLRYGAEYVVIAVEC